METERSAIIMVGTTHAALCMSSLGDVDILTIGIRVPSSLGGGRDVMDRGRRWRSRLGIVVRGVVHRPWLHRGRRMIEPLIAFPASRRMSNAGTVAPPGLRLGPGRGSHAAGVAHGVVLHHVGGRALVGSFFPFVLPALSMFFGADRLRGRIQFQSNRTASSTGRRLVAAVDGGSGTTRVSRIAGKIQSQLRRSQLRLRAFCGDVGNLASFR